MLFTLIRPVHCFCENISWKKSIWKTKICILIIGDVLSLYKQRKIPSVAVYIIWQITLHCAVCASEWFYQHYFLTQYHCCTKTTVSVELSCFQSAKSNPGSLKIRGYVLLCWYRHILLCLYYIASGITDCCGSEFRCPVSVTKGLMFYRFAK